MTTDHVRYTIRCTPGSWFVRGLFVGVLICGCLNAISYFFRSQSGGNLVGTAPGHREALGFPLQLWESSNTFNGYFIDASGLVVNGLFLAALSVACGLVTLCFRQPLTRLVREFEQDSREHERSGFQVSMRGLLVATGLAALAAAAVRYALAGRPEVLGFIYLLGPWLLVLFAFVPMGVAWQWRVVILVPTTFFLMAASVAVGLSLTPRLDFDKTLLGIFICWTPQTVLAAIILMVVALSRRVAPP